jgi:hypothetical protein
MTRIRTALSLLRGQYDEDATYRGEPNRTRPGEIPTDSKIDHWRTNRDEFERVTDSCRRCGEDQFCDFHEYAKRRF